MEVGKLIIITGPSGVGKGTLVKSLLARHPELHLSISATTRKPREGEINGKDYYFVTKAEFEAMIEAQELLEWAEYAGNYYGTPKKFVMQQLNQGKSVILEIEVIGANKVKENFAEAIRLFILPPSFEELERRLRTRGNDSESAIERRLQRAVEEIGKSDEFDQQIINEQLEEAIKQIEAAIFNTSSSN